MEPYLKTVQILISIFLLFGLVSCGYESDTGSIESVFQSYRSALLERDGETAYRLVSKETRDYYSLSANRAQKLSSKETKKLQILDQITVLLARHSIAKIDLKKMDGRAFFIHAINKGWISEESVSKAGIQVAEIDNNFAKTHLVVEGTEYPLGFSFRKENGEWKIDITSIFNVSRASFSEKIKEMSMSQEEFLFLVLESNNGVKPEDSVWEPIMVANE